MCMHRCMYVCACIDVRMCVCIDVCPYVDVCTCGEKSRKGSYRKNSF